MDIVCDTNIWYELGTGELKPSQLPAGNLVATFYNFEELTTSPNIVDSFPLVLGAAKAIVKFSKKQILDNAFLHIAKTVDPHFEDRTYSYNLGMQNWGEIRAIAAQSDSFTLTPHLKAEYQKNIVNRVTQSTAVAQIENQFVTSVRAHSQQLRKVDEKKYFKERFDGIVFELNDYFKLFTQGRLAIPRSKLTEFELFLTAFLQFARNTEIAKWVVQPNDSYDLYNLIYVRPGDKYFTKENRWKNLITEAGLSHYLA